MVGSLVLNASPRRVGEAVFPCVFCSRVLLVVSIVGKTYHRYPFTPFLFSTSQFTLHFSSQSQEDIVSYCLRCHPIVETTSPAFTFLIPCRFPQTVPLFCYGCDCGFMLSPSASFSRLPANIFLGCGNTSVYSPSLCHDVFDKPHFLAMRL